MADAKLKKGWALSWNGDQVSFSGEISTTHDADRLRAAIAVMASGLSSHRDAVAGDFGIIETPRPFADRMREFLG